MYLILLNSKVFHQPVVGSFRHLDNGACAPERRDQHSRDYFLDFVNSKVLGGCRCGVLNLISQYIETAATD